MGISNANKSRPMWNQHEASRTRSQIVYISTTYTLCVWVCAIEPTCGTWRNLQATWFLSDSRAHVRAANISNMPGTNWKMFHIFFFANTKIDPLIWLQQCTIDDNRQFIQFVNADIWRWRFVFFPSVYHHHSFEAKRRRTASFLNTKRLIAPSNISSSYAFHKDLPLFRHSFCSASVLEYGGEQRRITIHNPLFSAHINIYIMADLCWIDSQSCFVYK